MLRLTRSRRLARLLPGLFLLALVPLLAGWSTDRMSTFDPKGPLAKMQFELWLVTLYVTCVIFVIVGGILAYATWRYRERKTDDPNTIPVQTHGNPVVELGTIIFSVVALVFIGVPTVKGIWMSHDLPDELIAEQGGEVLEITVEGYQWWWAFDYPSLGIRTGNELVIPKGRVVKLNLRSKDVIHSFWLPKISGKVDLMPGRANWMWIKADEAGHYYGQCAEFCGEAHAYMLFRADVLEEADWEAWVKEQQKLALPPTRGTEQVAFAPAEGRDAIMDQWNAFLLESQRDPARTAGDPVLEGARLFFTKGACVQCHAIDGSPARGVLGPNLTRVGARRSLAAGILDHQDGQGGIDREAQFRNLVEWISQSEDHKPGNLMWTSIRKVFTPEERFELRRRGLDDASIQALEDQALTQEEFENLAHFLQALR